MALKGKGGGIFDLNAGQEARLLGLSLRREGKELKIGLVEDWRDRLRQNLIEVRDVSDPAKDVRQRLRLWIDAHGPALENGDAVIAEVFSIASELGFRELPEPKVVVAWSELAWRRWWTCRKGVRRRLGKKMKECVSSLSANGSAVAF